LTYYLKPDRIMIVGKVVGKRLSGRFFIGSQCKLWAIFYLVNYAELQTSLAH
jgi:hypothetical protein